MDSLRNPSGSLYENAGTPIFYTVLTILYNIIHVLDNLRPAGYNSKWIKRDREKDAMFTFFPH